MRVGFIAFGFLLGWSIMAHPAAAGVAITSSNTRWETSAVLGTITEPVQLFGALGSTGDGRWYQVTVEKASQLEVVIDVPVWADAKFHPQLVVYQPDSATVGPALFLVQPPDTIALVYPLTENKRQFEAWTQISTARRLQTQIDLPVVGTYYLAVYNADTAGGRFRLTITPPSSTKNVTGVLGWPKCWWISHIWANPSVTTLFFPLVLIGIIVTIIWTGMHWKAPKSREAPKTKRQIPKGKKAQ